MCPHCIDSHCVILIKVNSRALPQCDPDMKTRKRNNPQLSSNSCPRKDDVGNEFNQVFGFRKILPGLCEEPPPLPILSMVNIWITNGPLDGGVIRV